MITFLENAVLRFRFRPRHEGEDFDDYEQAFMDAWRSFCSRRGITPFPKLATGDAYLDAWNASCEYAERPLSRIIPLPLPARLGQLRPGRYRFLAVKYWRKNPARMWWLGHVWDEVRADWRGTAT